MAKKEFLEKRIEGKEKELTKLQKKLERIYKAQSSNWEVNPYYYHESDIRYTLRDIEAVKKALADYKSQLEAQIEKDNSRDVKVILDFLQEWKNRVYDIYSKGLQKLFADYNHRISLLRKVEGFGYGTPEYKSAYAELKEFETLFNNKKNGVYEDIPKTDPSYRRWVNDRRKVETGEYEWLRDFFKYRSLEDALNALKADLDAEANAKYDDIVERTNHIVGQITDASCLRIGGKGDLNGYIVGTKGKAKVNTIGAGGYNIQEFHFRTLIKPME